MHTRFASHSISQHSPYQHVYINDVTSGKKVKEPVLTPSQEMEPLPETWQKYLEYAGQLMAHIKTYDQKVYETQVEGDSIRVKL